MNNNDIASITTLDVRQAIMDFLQQRLTNNSNYKTELTKLTKAEENNDLTAISKAKQNLADIKQRFEFNSWMEDALVKRINWLIIATHLSKGIHPSSKGSNANYNTQVKSIPEYWVCSSTIKDLPYDATGSAAALDIFALLNQKVNGQVSLLQLIIEDHQSLIMAFSDDRQKSALYLTNLKKLLKDNWDNPQSSELNKQFYWPNYDNTYLSAEQNCYRLLIPLHPSSLCHVVYQKIQQRFSEQNKLAREQRYKKTTEQLGYFTFHNLAVVRLGGSNAQNASQLIGSQIGRNFLLPSLPPKITTNRAFVINKQQTTIFNNHLKYRCRQGFAELFAVVRSSENNKQIRERRKKDAFDAILAQIISTAKQLQQALSAGWSKEYRLDMNQKYWLDPKRAELEDEINFAEQYQRGEWFIALEKQFALWVNAILKAEFKDTASHFDDAEVIEWQREFSDMVKASRRRNEGVF